MKRIALVTGASSGIGRELCRLLAQDGHDLGLVARNKEQLEELAKELSSAYGIKAYVFPADLSDPKTPDQLFAKLAENGLSVDILVNNAGFGTHGLFASSDPKREMEMLEVNVKALAHLTRLALPGMLERKSGHILNMASTAAFQPGPLMAGYYASKAFVLSFSEALANELQGTGVTATVLCPGPTKTNFAKRAEISKEALFNESNLMDAATVARIGYRALLAGKPVAIAGHRNTIGAIATRFAPRGLAARMVRSVQDSTS